MQQVPTAPFRFQNRASQSEASEVGKEKRMCASCRHFVSVDIRLGSKTLFQAANRWLINAVVMYVSM